MAAGLNRIELPFSFDYRSVVAWCRERPRPWFVLNDLPQVRLRRPNFCAEKLDSQRMVVGRIMAIVEVEVFTDASTRQPCSLSVLIESTTCLFVNERNARAVDFRQRGNLTRKILKETV